MNRDRDADALQAVRVEGAGRAHHTRVLLAVPELERQKAIEHILGRVESIEVVGAAASGPEAVRLTEQLRPSLVIMGVELSMMNGFVATKEIMIRCPTPVLIIGGRLEGLSSMANESAYRAGALSYLPEAPNPGDEQMAEVFLDIVERVALSHATRYYRIRQSWATDTQVQAVAVFVANASVEALAQVLSLLPEDFAAPVMVLPYIGKGFTEGFASWLQRNCALNVKVADQGDFLAPATVYVAPHDRHLEIVEERVPRLHLSSTPAVRGFRPSGVHLLSTLARVYGPRGLAVVMSGTREDLVAAMCAIWLEGGRVFVQAHTERTAGYWPPEQILHTLADAVMAPADLAASFIRMAMAKREE